MKCPNLKKLFPKYRLDWDPARSPRSQDPWMLLIPCLTGTICPFGPGELLWEGERHNGIGKRVAEIGRLHCDGDQYKSVVFYVDQFAKVAKIVKPRTKRTMSAAQKAACAKNLAKARAK